MNSYEAFAIHYMQLIIVYVNNRHKYLVIYHIFLQNSF